MKRPFRTKFQASRSENNSSLQKSATFGAEKRTSGEIPRTFPEHFGEYAY